MNLQKIISIIAVLSMISLPMVLDIDTAKGIEYQYKSHEIYRTTGFIYQQHERLSETCSVVTTDDVIHILWVESRIGFPPFSLKYVQTTNGGSVEEPITLDMQAAFCYWKLISNSDYLYGFYTSFSQYSNTTCDIYFIKTSLNEINWTTQLVYSYNQTTVLSSPSLVVNENNVYIFWTINNSILSLLSENQGENWSNVTVIHNTPNNCGSVRAGITDNSIHLIWSDSRNYSNNLNELYYIRSMDNGHTWSGETKLIGIPRYSSDYMGIIPSFEIQMGHLYLLFTDTFGKKLYLLHSNDNGTTWAIQSNLFIDEFTGNYLYSRVVREDKIAILRPDSGNWILIQSHDYGQNWTNTTLEGEFQNPALLFLNNHIGVIDTGYDATTDESIIYYMELEELKIINTFSLTIGLILIIISVLVALFVYRKKHMSKRPPEPKPEHTYGERGDNQND